MTRIPLPRSMSASSPVHAAFINTMTVSPALWEIEALLTLTLQKYLAHVCMYVLCQVPWGGGEEQQQPVEIFTGTALNL